MFQRAVFNVDTDTEVLSAGEIALPGSIFVFDGIFLHRPELRSYWDFSAFLRVEWNRNHRTRNHSSDDWGPGDPRNNRYIEGQEIYFQECKPWENASVVVDNDDLRRPFILPDRPQ